jgi:hypothetical protein
MLHPNCSLWVPIVCRQATTAMCPAINDLWCYWFVPRRISRSQLQMPTVNMMASPKSAAMTRPHFSTSISPVLTTGYVSWLTSWSTDALKLTSARVLGTTLTAALSLLTAKGKQSQEPVFRLVGHSAGIDVWWGHRRLALGMEQSCSLNCCQSCAWVVIYSHLQKWWHSLWIFIESGKFGNWSKSGSCQTVRPVTHH